MADRGLVSNGLLKSCLLTGSIAVILQAAKLYVSSSSIVYIRFLLGTGSTSTEYRVLLPFCITSIVAQMLILLLCLFLLYGLIKIRLGFLKAFIKPTAICYVIEILVYMITIIYIGFIVSYEPKIVFVLDLATRLVTLLFLCMVRSHVKDLEYIDSCTMGYISNEVPERFIGDEPQAKPQAAVKQNYPVEKF